MTKSDSSKSLEIKSPCENSPRPTLPWANGWRIDPPHEIARALPDSDTPAIEAKPETPPVIDEPAAEPIRLQADQLAAHLRNRQKELDRRESELNSRLARWESETRVARLASSEREAELAAREESLNAQQRELATQAEALAKKEQAIAEQQAEFAQEQEDFLQRREIFRQKQQERQQEELDFERRLSRLAAADIALRKRTADFLKQHDKETRYAVETLTTKQKLLKEAEIRLAETQAETEKLYEQLATQRREFDEETTAARNRMAEAYRQAEAELEQKRQAVQRRADQVEQRHATLKQLRSDLGRMHRETLEIRLATEELWAQLAGNAPPASLTQSLGRIRTQLAEQYQQARIELAEQRKELEAIRVELTRQHGTLAEQKKRFEQWAEGHHEECRRQAERLIAREELLQREKEQVLEESERWRAERIQYQQELYRLRAGRTSREESIASAE
jgi:hypothetical protein